MDVQRRILLKGMTATAAMSMITPHNVFSEPLEQAVIMLRETSAGGLVCKPITLVSSEAFQASTFVHAARRLQPAQQVVLKGVDIVSLQQLLSQKSTNLVGIIDHANAAVLVQVARHLGAKVHWLGQHSLKEESTAHNILKSGDSRPCHSALVEGLEQCEAAHAVREQGLPSTAILGDASATHSQSWAGQLAVALHDVGKGVAHSTAEINPSSQLMYGTAVTFLIETC